jgi:hypothetical protein
MSSGPVALGDNCRFGAATRGGAGSWYPGWVIDELE